MTTRTRSLPAPLAWTQSGSGQTVLFYSTFYELEDGTSVVVGIDRSYDDRANSWNVTIYHYSGPPNGPDAVADIVKSNRRPRIGLANAKSDGVDMLLDWLGESGHEAMREDVR